MEKNPGPQSGPLDTSQTRMEKSPLPASNALLWDALPELKLNIAQTAALCGISVRQLGYWTKQGYVTASGRGSRRLYGLESLRRILAIRSAMGSGASLRQALRALDEGPDAPPLTLSPGPDLSQPAPLPGEAHSSLPPAYAESLAQSLLTLFDANRRTRDNAMGLATKLGFAEEDVRNVAEILCADGALTRSVSQGDIIFQRAGEGL